ncbi:MAG: TIGR04551 family protein [Deltaproteobacteria bacterium]|nr:TIGR04551 family protein [Deltaproteobacteria bacterium]
MRLTVLLSCFLVVSWGAFAKAQDTRSTSTDTSASDASVPDGSSDSSVAEPQESSAKSPPQTEKPSDFSEESQDIPQTDGSPEAGEGKSESVEKEQPSVPPPSLTPQVVAPAPSAALNVPSPDDAQGRLEADLPEALKTEEPQSTASQPVLTLHGYMRMRGELQDTFWLGRAFPDEEDEYTPEPFLRFLPLENRIQNRPADCGDDCDVDSLQFANLRLRLAPQLNISDDVRVKMMFDLFDNMVAGSTPASFYGAPPAGTTDAFSSTDIPPEQSNLRDKIGDSIVVRRAWGEVRNRSLGELRFGRMRNHWGLGIMNNSGDELDDDFSSEIDKLMLITKLVGIYFSASYDFIFEGFLKPNDSTGLVSEVNQLDDVDQFSFTVSRRLDPEEQTLLLERGGVALNGGIYFSYREQDYYTYDPEGSETEALAKLGAETFTFDGFGELRWEGLRLGYEGSFTFGSINDLSTADESDDKLDILQFGTAFEFELRLLDEKLGIYFDSGFASGDGSVEGLSSYDNFIDQRDSNRTVSTFRFHPAYRIDLILWRSIMRQITGAYYFRPGINYDFIRNQFGQLFGARLNVLWSRAAVPKQTWGDDPDLGVELDLSLYWRSEDGPELFDGFHAMVQWGILFPLQGLGYTSEDLENYPNFDELEIPNALRVVLGIVF